MNPIKKLWEDKKEFKEYEKRRKALPQDYQFVYDKMQSYMWEFAGGTGMDMVKTMYDLIEMFEEGVAEGKQVLEITGEDVAGFCDELMKGNRLWTDHQRHKLNQKVKKITSSYRKVTPFVLAILNCILIVLLKGFLRN